MRCNSINLFYCFIRRIFLIGLGLIYAARSEGIGKGKEICDAIKIVIVYIQLRELILLFASKRFLVINDFFYSC